MDIVFIGLDYKDGKLPCATFGRGWERVFLCVNEWVDEKKLILKLELYFPVYWEDYVMAKMVDDYSILIQLIFYLSEEKKN